MCCFKINEKQELQGICHLLGNTRAYLRKDNSYAYDKRCQRRIYKKVETAVHCCDPTLLVLVMLVSRNVFHVVSNLQSIACLQNKYLLEEKTISSHSRETRSWYLLLRWDFT